MSMMRMREKYPEKEAFPARSLRRRSCGDRTFSGAKDARKHTVGKIVSM